MENALAKDPLAGRHEMIKQEAIRMAHQAPSIKHVSVREWQTMKHTDLRAQQACEEIERRMLQQTAAPGRDGGERPEWNALHHLQV
jgi:hypothetical protein